MDWTRVKAIALVVIGLAFMCYASGFLLIALVSGQ